MHLKEGDAQDLKVWIIHKLEEYLPEVDQNVLADYVLVLVGIDKPDPDLEDHITDQLIEFLKDNTAQFVRQLFKVLNSRTYTSRPLETERHDEDLPTGPEPPQAPTSNAIVAEPTGLHQQAASGNQRRKRNHSETNANHIGIGERDTFGDLGHQRDRRDGSVKRRKDLNGAPTFAQPAPVRPNSNLRMRPPEFEHNEYMMPTFDQTGAAAAAFMAFGQAMGLQFPPLARIGSPVHGLQGSQSRSPCVDYNTKGICTRGANCPFDHGTNQILIPQPVEYDPNSPFAPMDLASMLAPQTTFGRSKSQSSLRRNRRAVFSAPSANNDKSLRTIVVEQIPEENLDLQQIGNFFRKFGAIGKIDMQPERRLAIIRYEAYDSARAAYESPEVIFGNRFVKVYWYRPNGVLHSSSEANGTNGLDSSRSHTTEDEPEFDRVKFEEKLAEAQKRFEEKFEVRQKLGIKAREVEEKTQELEEQILEARRELAEKMIEKGIEPPAVVLHTNGNGRRSPNAEALKVQLATLQAHARDLGIDPNDLDEHYHTSHQYGSGFRGRGTYRGRGAYRGQKWHRPYTPNIPFKGKVHAEGRYNLDLRPKRIRVSAVDGTWDHDKDEALREYLFTLGDIETTETVPSDEEGDVIASFRDRWSAEDFFYGPREIPNVGKVHLSWVANLKVTIEDASRLVDGDDVQMGGDDTKDVFGDANFVRVEYRPDARDDEYDVAEVDDGWDVR